MYPICGWSLLYPFVYPCLRAYWQGGLQTQRARDQIPQGAEVDMEEELRELELLMVVETVLEVKTLMEVEEDVA